MHSTQHLQTILNQSTNESHSATTLVNPSLKELIAEKNFLLLQLQKTRYEIDMMTTELEKYDEPELINIFSDEIQQEEGFKKVKAAEIESFIVSLSRSNNKPGLMPKNASIAFLLNPPAQEISYSKESIVKQIQDAKKVLEILLKEKAQLHKELKVCRQDEEDFASFSLQNFYTKDKIIQTTFPTYSAARATVCKTMKANSTLLQRIR